MVYMEPLLLLGGNLEVVFLTRISLKKDFFYLFILERWEGREGEREGSIHVQGIHQLVASSMSPAGDLARSPGMCPDQESNQ